MRRQWGPQSSATYELLRHSESRGLPLPHGGPRRHRGKTFNQICPRHLTLRRARYSLVLIALLTTFGIISSGIPSTYKEIRAYERQLPQHNATLALTEGTPYLRISEHVTGRGLNNVLQEAILLSYLAYRVQRAYVFEDYIWSRLPTPYVVYDYALRPSRLPLNAFISGPTAGGPMSAPRAISSEFWESVCPPERRHIISSADQPKDAEGNVILDWWIEKLNKLHDQCVEIDARPQEIFDYVIFGDPRLLSIWPGLAKSPIMKDFTWSPLVQSALKANEAILEPAPRSSDDITPISVQPGLVAIHLRRGDFAGHCKYLARYSASFMGFNQFPEFLDKFDNRKFPTNDQARNAQYLEHCLPTVEQIVEKLRVVREANPTLRRVYVMTNGRKSWLDGLKDALRQDGWEDIKSSLDLRLNMEQLHVSVAVDMAIAERSEVFIGNGFSSLTSNIATLRMAKGLNPATTRFL